MRLDVQPKKSATLAPSRSTEGHSSVCAILALSILFSKSGQQKVRSLETEFKLYSKGVSIGSFAKCRTRSKTAVSCLQEEPFGYSPLRNHLQLL